MRATLSIGDFSQATLLSVKTLRHYHEVGLLEPADVDPSSGHRRYSTDQIPTAQVIRRFRALDMPIDEIRGLLVARDPRRRNELIVAHLDRLEATLERTVEAVTSLRGLVESPDRSSGTDAIEHRIVAATAAAAIRETVEMGDLVLWFEGAFGEIYATLKAQDVIPDGPGGGVYDSELFTEARGRATVFVPCRTPFRASGRVESVVIPAAELAIATHVGDHAEADRTYGALATHVARRALGLDGPIREYYLVSSRDTSEAKRWRTEIGWPIFDVGMPH